MDIHCKQFLTPDVRKINFNVTVHYKNYRAIYIKISVENIENPVSSVVFY